MNFLFGASTSSHQVEGNNTNDWTRWELQSANSKSQIAKRKEWPKYLLERYPSPLQEENYISGKAADHYHRFEEDFDIAKELGHNAHRFSVEWSRIEPRKGEFDESELEHYRQVVHALRKRGIEPFVTLWHWTLPRWLADKGGVLNKRFPEYFARYTEQVVEALSGSHPERSEGSRDSLPAGRQVRQEPPAEGEARSRERQNDKKSGSTTNGVNFWITINEPLVVVSQAYLRGAWPPQRKNPFAYLRAIARLIAAHKKAHNAIKKACPNARVGIAKHNLYFSGIFAPLKRWFWNKRFLTKINNHQDFVGVNFYFGQCNAEKQSDMGWALCPQDIYHVLKDAARYHVPLYITENGLADAQDNHRAWFITETIRHLQFAIREGVDLRGYFHWSLLDNFEWDKGFWPRFGLVEVDYETLERTVRPSAWEYKKAIQAWNNE